MKERKRTSHKKAPVIGEVPLPPGKGAAKRRVRAKDRPSSGPTGHLLPKGEATRAILFQVTLWQPHAAGSELFHGCCSCDWRSSRSRNVVKMTGVTMST